MCIDTLVGNDQVKGISGGQKKRVTTGVQTLLTPGVVDAWVTLRFYDAAEICELHCAVPGPCTHPTNEYPC